MTDLQVSLTLFLDDLRVMNTQLILLRSHWEGLAAAPEEGGRGSVDAFVVELFQLGVFTKTLLTQAAQVRVDGSAALTVVASELQDHPRKVNEAATQLAAAKQARDQAFRDLDAAKSQVSGAEGFFNGLLTGLTLTLYNPIQDNINKANAAIARINSSYSMIQNRVDTLSRVSQELQACQGLLDVLSGLDSNLTDYENSLNAAQRALMAAHDDELVAAAPQSSGVADYYRRRCAKDMNSLLAWIAVFESTLA